MREGGVIRNDLQKMATADFVRNSICTFQKEKAPYKSLRGPNVEMFKYLSPVIVFFPKTVLCCKCAKCVHVIVEGDRWFELLIPADPSPRWLNEVMSLLSDGW